MSADIRLYNPFNKRFKLECYRCGKEILNLNNVSEGHEKCIEEQNDYDINKEDYVMRINWDCIKMEKNK